jgi:hypothetical protein
VTQVFTHSILGTTPVYPDREVALTKRAVTHQYAGKSPAELTQIAEELCLSAARIKRFDTLSSHLCELARQSKHQTFGED